MWAYGYFCALLIYLRGQPVVLSDDGRKVLFHPSAWRGISFTVRVLFVLIFTNARARGVKSLVVFAVACDRLRRADPAGLGRGLELLSVAARV